MDWDDYGKIAKALNKLYPNRSPSAIEDEELIGLVTALPGFTGESQPPDDRYTSFISSKWIMIKSGETTPYSPPPI